MVWMMRMFEVFPATAAAATATAAASASADDHVMSSAQMTE